MVYGLEIPTLDEKETISVRIVLGTSWEFYFRDTWKRAICWADQGSLLGFVGRRSDAGVFCDPTSGFCALSDFRQVVVLA